MAIDNTSLMLNKLSTIQIHYRQTKNGKKGKINEDNNVHENLQK